MTLTLLFYLILIFINTLAAAAFTSEVTLPFEVMPPVMQKIVGVFPLTQGIAMMKHAFVGGQMENILLPVCVMLGLTILCTGLAIRFFRWE